MTRPFTRRRFVHGAAWTPLGLCGAADVAAATAVAEQSNLFPGFERRAVDVGDVKIACRIGGKGPPLLLLHGYPQTHAMWHKIAPALAEHFTLVLADLRGYGDSSQPRGAADHANYSKRAMANDQVEVMRRLGFERFAVVGHDRGARVARRMALDHPQRLTRVAVLDIVPTDEMYARADKAFATAYFHWFFLIQPADLPERLISGAPEYFLRHCLTAWSRTPGAFDDAALSEYLRCFRRPETIHATCEDYRAAATIDLEHDAADRQKKIACPLLALWGGKGFVARQYDVLRIWRARANDVRGEALPCGHFLPEESPAETQRAVLAFLQGRH